MSPTRGGQNGGRKRLSHRHSIRPRQGVEHRVGGSTGKVGVGRGPVTGVRGVKQQPTVGASRLLAGTSKPCGSSLQYLR
jgi:hypothetical protein